MRLVLVALLVLTFATLAGGSNGGFAARSETVARVDAIALGGEHSCAVTEAGEVRCWGWNNDGQLGDGTTQSHSVAIDVSGLHTPIVQMAAGYNHTCALSGSSMVQCWGANANGQLGAASGLCGSLACSTTPLEVTGLSDVASIAAGYAHTCAITTGSSLKCWGFNRYGQLGDGTKLDRISPVTIIADGVAAVAPGDVQTCALMNDSTVRCWGNNLLGELGNGTRAESVVPATVCHDIACDEPLNGIVQVSAGDHHACAVDTIGDVYCWGSNIVGQLGVATTEGCPSVGLPCSTLPVRVTSLAAPAASVSAGTASTCALLTSGGVQCWGQQLDSPNSWSAPTGIETWQSGLAAVAAAKGHACAVTDTGEMLCFGANQYGQLGNGTLGDIDDSSPRRVWLLSGRGDADCDTRISSLDAAFVLQYVAQLLSALPCPNATAAIGQEISSTDALAILQFSARLLT